MNQLPQLETPRLLLKVLDDSYAEKVLDFFVRNRSFLARWEPARDETFFTVDVQRQQLLSDLAQMAEERMFQVWLFLKEDRALDTVLGSVALNAIVRGCFQSCFLGYRIDEHYTNRGYMTEAVRRIVEHAFADLKLHRIEANIILGNGASLRVVEKLGFYQEGLAKKYLYINGQWEDHAHMVIRNLSME